MSEWTSYSVGQVARWQGGFAFPSSAFIQDGVPIVRMSDLKDGRLNLAAAEKVPKTYLQELQNFALREGDFLMGMTGSLENHAVVAPQDLPALLNQRVGRLVSKSDAVEYKFVILALLADNFKRHAEKEAAGAAQKNISPSQIERYVFLCPVDLLEQRRIAKILATVDEAIEQTEALVQKWQQLKAGLMHDLFNRGVTAAGQLRPTRQAAPQLYKQSSLGWIPKEWEALKFAALLNSIDSGWSPECVEVPPPYGEWGVLKVSAVTSGRFVASESKTLPPHLRPLPELEVKAGDVITARANGVASLVGITVQVKNCPPSLMLSDKLLRLNPSALATRDFLAGLMMSAATRSQLEGLMSGSSGQRNISQQQIRNLTTVRPPLAEQNLITDAQSSLERSIEIESVHLAKLRAQKQGLMQDLLTGRVPVKISPETKT